jgi:integrase
MRGSVTKREGSWSFVVDRGIDPVTGKRRQQRRSGFRTRQTAEDALRRTIQQLTDGTFVERTDQTVDEYLTEWLAGLTARRQVKAKTVKSYEECVARVRPDLGPIRLQALKPVDVERCYSRLLTEGGREGKGLHARTVLHTHRVLHKAMADAERLGLVVRNPVARVTPPSAPISTSVDNVWSAEELKTFLEASAEEPLYPAFVLAATTGMRRGEVAALRWSSVDLDTGVLRVEESVIPVRGELVFTPPKTKKGVRVLTLDSGTLAVMKAHRKRQAERQLALGSAWEDTGRVFTREDGSVLHPDKLSKRFDVWVHRSGLPRITFHGLRHTWATMAMEKGIHTKVVSDRLGHANISVTLDIYSKVRPAMDAQAAELVAADLFAPAASERSI